MKSLGGRVAIITGAASGIGKAIAHALAQRDVRIVVADVNRPACEALIQELGSQASLLIHCDVADPECFHKIYEAAMCRFQRIDIVVNNVGVISSGLPQDIPIEEWQRVIDINLLSVVRSNHAFLPGLLAQGDGHIVNTASFAGLFPYAYDRLPYAASKAALISLSAGLALYLNPRGVGVTCLCPGPVATHIGATVRSFTPGLKLRGPGARFEMLQPDAVGTMLVDAIERNLFFLPSHPAVRESLLKQANDPNAFISEQIQNVLRL